MQYEKVAAELSETVLGEIKECLQGVRQRIPVQVKLSALERQRLFKMGGARQAFVENTYMAARNHPEALPAGYDIEEIHQHMRLAAAFTEIVMELKKLVTEIDDAKMAVSSQAMEGGADIYRHVKAAAVRKPGLKSVAQQLGALYQKARRVKKVSAPK